MVTNTEVLERTNCISIEAMLLKSCLRWTGYVIRMEDHCIPKRLLFGELVKGHRKQGRPCKRFNDTVKAGLKWCGIPPAEQVDIALDRQRWSTLTQSASSALEEERSQQAQSARERRHLAASIPATMRISSAQSAHGSASPGSTFRVTPVYTEAQTMSSSRTRNHHDDEIKTCTPTSTARPEQDRSARSTLINNLTSANQTNIDQPDQEPDQHWATGQTAVSETHYSQPHQDPSTRPTLK